jgi:hypothetical protein
MSEGEKRRERIFNVYASQLNLLKDNQLIALEVPLERIYICPICLNPFAIINNSGNPLTLEDAPPKSLGGTANILTCKKCNNTAGQKIDFHLAERMNELDSRSFKPGTESKLKIKIGQDVFNGTLTVGEDGAMSMFHSNENNHPEKLAKAMQSLKAGTMVSTEFLKSKVIPENLEYALLKTGYLLAFKRFGYSLILDECYAQVREQLLKPEVQLYPPGFWFSPPPQAYPNGVFFVLDKGLESVISIFETKTRHSIRAFGTILPLPINPVSEVIEKINAKLESEKQFKITLYPLDQGSDNYVSNIESIKAMKKWISDRKSNT